MARGIRTTEPKITELKPSEMPEDSGSRIYRDKAGADRLTVMTEGGSNLASMVARHAADEAARLAKAAEAAGTD